MQGAEENIQQKPLQLISSEIRGEIAGWSIKGTFRKQKKYLEIKNITSKMKNSIEVKVKDIYQQTEQKDRNEKYE